MDPVTALAGAARGIRRSLGDTYSSSLAVFFAAALRRMAEEFLEITEYSDYDTAGMTAESVIRSAAEERVFNEINNDADRRQIMGEDGDNRDFAMMLVAPSRTIAGLPEFERRMRSGDLPSMDEDGNIRIVGIFGPISFEDPNEKPKQKPQPPKPPKAPRKPKIDLPEKDDDGEPLDDD